MLEDNITCSIRRYYKFDIFYIYPFNNQYFNYYFNDINFEKIILEKN